MNGPKRFLSGLSYNRRMPGFAFSISPRAELINIEPSDYLADTDLAQ